MTGFRLLTACEINSVAGGGLGSFSLARNKTVNIASGNMAQPNRHRYYKEA